MFPTFIPFSLSVKTSEGLLAIKAVLLPCFILFSSKSSVKCYIVEKTIELLTSMMPIKLVYESAHYLLTHKLVREKQYVGIQSTWYFNTLFELIQKLLYTPIAPLCAFFGVCSFLMKYAQNHKK